MLPRKPNINRNKSPRLDVVGQEPSPDRPGQMLRKARQARKLDIEDIASRLNLKPSVIRALEADNYKSIPTTFVKGYLRNYAKLLGLPSDQLVKMYEAATGCVDPMDEAHPLPEPSKKPGHVGFGSALVALLVLMCGVLVAWYWKSGGAETGSVPNYVGPDVELVEKISSPKIVDQDKAVNQTPQQKELSPESLPEHQSDQLVPSIVKKTTPQPESRGETTAAQTHKSPVLHDSNTPIVPSEQTRPGQMAAGMQPQRPTRSAMATDIKPEELARVDRARLEMQFSEKCWIEVRDKFNKVLVSTIKANGSHLKLEGQPPFDIKIGNGKAVKLSYNGEPVRFAYSNKTSVARLSVGE